MTRNVNKSDACKKHIHFFWLEDLYYNIFNFSGRVARAGRSGMAYSFIVKDEVDLHTLNNSLILTCCIKFVFNIQTLLN